jgi:hypothetical protein
MMNRANVMAVTEGSNCRKVRGAVLRYASCYSEGESGRFGMSDRAIEFVEVWLQAI